MILQPFNNIVIAQLLEKPEESAVILPDRKVGRFIRLRILAAGPLVEYINAGDIVWANAMLEIIDARQNSIGFINSRDILAKEKEGTTYDV